MNKNQVAMKDLILFKDYDPYEFNTNCLYEGGFDEYLTARCKAFSDTTEIRDSIVWWSNELKTFSPCFEADRTWIKRIKKHIAELKKLYIQQTIIALAVALISSGAFVVACFCLI